MGAAANRGSGGTAIVASTAVAALVGLALTAGSALGNTSSLPSVPVGPPPGPAVLHAPAASTPILENTGVWRSAPTMVSGTERYDRGEYIYTDYIYDDHGADTGAPPGAAPEPRPPRTSLMVGPPTGDVVYPTDEDRYGYNAADLLELRIHAGDDAVRYRFTLNTMLVEDATAIAVGIDTDGGDEETDWGHGIGELGPLGLDHIFYTDGVQATVTTTDGTEHQVSVTTDVARNQIEVTVPREVIDPDETDVWRHYAVTGIADGEGGFAQVGQQPSESEPGGANLDGATGDVPPVLNVAFRFEARGDEPMGVGDEPELQHPLYGSWREHGQANALADRDISAFHADIDFGKLADGAIEDNVPTSGFMNRLHVSALDLGQGVADERPWFLGQIQPYAIYVPEAHDPSEPAGLLLTLHSLSASHNQFQAASPETYIDLAEERGAIAITPLARGPDGWYHHEAEVDVFEVWADVARNYAIDPDRVAITGYSMGGYGTLRFTSLYPDLFTRGFPVVGPPGENISPVVDPGFVDDAGGAYGAPPETDTTPLLDNVRNIPLLIWIGLTDELVPAPGVIAHAQRLDLLGYRYYLDMFTADHFLLAVIDDWSRAAAFLGDPTIDRDPAHVTYRVRPQTHVPELGLVHDSAYWVWDIEVADPAQDHGGLVDARSLIHGEGEPETEPVVGAGPDPLPYVREGQEWASIASITAENRLEADLTNVSSVTFGLERAGLDPADEPTVTLSTDVEASPVFVAGFPRPLRVVDEDGDGVAFTRDGDEVTVALAAGDHELTFLSRPPSATTPAPADPARALPATGGGTAAVGLLILAGVAALRVNRTPR